MHHERRYGFAPLGPPRSWRSILWSDLDANPSMASRNLHLLSSLHTREISYCICAEGTVYHQATARLIPAPMCELLVDTMQPISEGMRGRLRHAPAQLSQRLVPIGTGDQRTGRNHKAFMHSAASREVVQSSLGLPIIFGISSCSWSHPRLTLLLSNHPNSSHRHSHPGKIISLAALCAERYLCPHIYSPLNTGM
jgi:hypothetical protein